MFSTLEISMIPLQYMPNSALQQLGQRGRPQRAVGLAGQELRRHPAPLREVQSRISSPIESRSRV